MSRTDLVDAILFEGFRLDRNGLFRVEPAAGDEPVALGSRALDLLRVLAERQGEIVSKDAIMAAVWPGQVVEESNLTVQVSALRRALDQDRPQGSCIQTVTGRGYRFIAALSGANKPTFGNSPALALPDKPSIAVLPFQNMSGDPEQEYFVDGMVEEIITALSRIRWLFVIARNSSFTYKGRAVDVKQAGRELGVRYVLEGSVRKAGGRMRITAQLIDAETGAHLWADRFDGSLEDVFDLQDKVAAAVAGIIEPALQTAEIVRSVRRPTTDLTAYDLYLRALGRVFTVERRGYLDALELLRQAIGRDPNYGAAMALAAHCQLALHLAGWTDEAEASRREGLDLAQCAIRAAGNDAGTLARAAYVLGYFGEELDAVIPFIERSLELNPSSTDGWQRSGWLRLWSGQADLAIRHFERALRLNPGDPSHSTLMGIGAAYLVSRRFAEARAILLRVLQEQPAWVPIYRLLAACCAHMGRLDEARRFIAQLRALTPVVVPAATHWREPEQRELYMSGLRLAIAEET
jgi:TolB-like protein